MVEPQKGRDPVYQGVIQEGSVIENNIKEVAKIALWEFENAKGTKNAPLFTGSITMGESKKKYKVSLWKFSKKSEQSSL